MPLCAARFYIFESASSLIFEARLFSARGAARMGSFIFFLPAYRLAFGLAARSPRVFCVRLRRIPAVVFVLPKPFPFTFSVRLFLSFKILPVVSCVPAKREIALPFSERFSETDSAC